MTIPPARPLSRREFLLCACGFPFFWRRGRVTLGGVCFRRRRRGRSSTRYLVIHGDEETARVVLEDHLRMWPGVAHIVTGRRRTVKVPGGTLDPNRMFSRSGAEANLLRLNPGWQPAQLARALDRLDRLRPKMVDALIPPPGGLLFALHNNARGYSVDDEISISDAVSLRNPGQPHEFFLCTAQADFAVLAQSQYNVVLQRDKPAADDGSLSRLAARLGVRYVNLEVGIGKPQIQRDMLEWAAARLTPDRPT
ncbi:MAG TPA: hypothetical protein VN442_21010 [Bryobacteraceae bacterium]|nr:hypothetical protein [Bryobacteraceae bacterium]